MSMFDISPEFAEQLGAYIEGNLSYEDTCQMEQMISANDELNSFVNELHDDNFTSLGDFATYDYFNLDTNFALPEIPDYTFGTGSGIFADVPDVFENSTMKLWENDEFGTNQSEINADFLERNDNDLMI